MRDRDGSLVFVEVRFRRDASYGSGLESVSWHKQQRLKQAASNFLVCHGRYANLACRFDVVGVSRSEDNARLNMEWIKNAFS